MFHNSPPPLTSRPAYFFLFLSMYLPTHPCAHHSPCPAAEAAALAERGESLVMDRNNFHNDKHKYKPKYIKTDG